MRVEEVGVPTVRGCDVGVSSKLCSFLGVKFTSSNLVRKKKARQVFWMVKPVKTVATAKIGGAAFRC
jgi:hypothetical protein